MQLKIIKCGLLNAFLIGILLINYTQIEAQNQQREQDSIEKYVKTTTVFTDSFYRPFSKEILFQYAANIIKPDSFDIHLLNACIFYFTNEYRQKHNKAKLNFLPELRNAALYHALQMSEKNFYNHFNPYNFKLKEPYDRIKYFGFAGEYCGENIHKTFMMNYEEGNPYDGNFKTKQFYYVGKKKNDAITYFTYLELAQKIVNDWIASKPHQKNMLDANYWYLGVGVMIDKKSYYGKDIPRILAVQNFGGELPYNPYDE